MRKVILAAALAVTFTLPLRSHAQQGGGGASAGGTAAGTPAAGTPAAGTPAAGSGNVGAGQVGSPAAATTQGPAPSGGGVQAGPPTTGNFSVQGQSQGMLGGAEQSAPVLGGTGGAGQNTGAGAPSAPGAGGTASPGVVNASPPAPVGTAVGDPQVELARLRSEVDRLRAELDSLKAEQGQGGKATGGAGAEEDSEAELVASATFEGRVRKVSKESIVVIDRETGEPYVLRVNRGTQARSGEQRIPLASIREGSEVRASFNFASGNNYATHIQVLPKVRR